MEQLMPISKIFSEKIFRIQNDQRGYTWSLKEIEDFGGICVDLKTIKIIMCES